MDSPKLKPCPHCGGTDIRIGFDCLEERHYALCCDCLMRGPGMHGDNNRAKDAWTSPPRRNEITPNSVDCAGCPERRYRQDTSR